MFRSLESELLAIGTLGDQPLTSPFLTLLTLADLTAPCAHTHIDNPQTDPYAALDVLKALNADLDLLNTQQAAPAVTVYLPCCGAPPSQLSLQTWYALDFRPRTTYFGATGQYSLADVTWQVWNSTEAVGTGTAEVDTCQPACAGGRFATAPVTVTLSGPQKCGGTWFWSKMVWHFTAGIPPRATQDDTFTFSC